MNLLAEQLHRTSLLATKAAHLGSVIAANAHIVALGIMKVAQLGSAIASNACAVAQWIMNAALWACPLVWFIALIVGAIAVIAGIIYVIMNWSKVLDFISTSFKKVWSWIQNLVKAMGGWKNVLLILLGPIGIMILAITKVVSLFGGWKKMLGGVWQMFLLLLNPIKLLKILLSTIKFPAWLQKLVDGFLGKGAKEIAGGKTGGAFKSSADQATEQEKSKRELKKVSLSPQTSAQTIWNKQKSSIVNNSANVTIHSSGAIDSKQAPRIADIMVSTLHSKGQMG